MKWKWKSVNRIIHFSAFKLTAALSAVLILFSLSSCSNSEEHKHISDSHLTEIDGLTKPSNQIVVSDINTVLPLKRSINPLITVTGEISYDPRLNNNISSRYSGRIEKMYVRFNFEKVVKGQRIMDLYSPDILTAQQNYLFVLINSPADEVLISSTKQKLILLGVTEEQIKLIRSSLRPINPLPVYSPYSGHIHDIGVSENSTIKSPEMGGAMNSNYSAESDRKFSNENIPASQSSSLSLKEGMYIQNGQTLFSVFNTSRIWAILNIFPGDAELIRIGDKVTLTTETNASADITSTISYIEPVASANAAFIKARVYIDNTPQMDLTVGTLITGKITVQKKEGMWLPRNAVVNLGQKQIVFLKKENHFITHTIITGRQTDSLTEVISGLQYNDLVAFNAQYMVDSESFIQSSDEH